MKFKKYEGNPILRPNPERTWESLCVLNPAVVYDEDREEFVMVYRCAGFPSERVAKNLFIQVPFFRYFIAFRISGTISTATVVPMSAVTSCGQEKVAVKV